MNISSSETKQIWRNMKHGCMVLSIHTVQMVVYKDNTLFWNGSNTYNNNKTLIKKLSNILLLYGWMKWEGGRQRPMYIVEVRVRYYRVALSIWCRPPKSQVNALERKRLESLIRSPLVHALLHISLFDYSRSKRVRALPQLNLLPILTELFVFLFFILPKYLCHYKSQICVTTRLFTLWGLLDIKLNLDQSID